MLIDEINCANETKLINMWGSVETFLQGERTTKGVSILAKDVGQHASLICIAGDLAVLLQFSTQECLRDVRCRLDVVTRQ